MEDFFQRSCAWDGIDAAEEADDAGGVGIVLNHEVEIVLYALDPIAQGAGAQAFAVVKEMGAESRPSPRVSLGELAEGGEELRKVVCGNGLPQRARREGREFREVVAYAAAPLGIRVLRWGALREGVVFRQGNLKDAGRAVVEAGEGAPQGLELGQRQFAAINHRAWVFLQTRGQVREELKERFDGVHRSKRSSCLGATSQSKWEMWTSKLASFTTSRVVEAWMD